jgi:hypothetical protein
MITIQELYGQVRELAKKINAPVELLPTFGTSDLSGRPYIVIRGDTYHYLANDRDAVIVNRETTSLPKLLYWIFDYITGQMGSTYEKEHRIPDVDPRRLAFKKQLELLENLYPQWKDLRQEEIQFLLEKHPYRDELRR